MGARVEVCHGDVRAALAAGASFDVAVANPPYRTLDEGPASPDVEVATAQHELEVTLADVAAAMRRALKPGRPRGARLSGGTRRALFSSRSRAPGCGHVRARFVHPRADEPANRVLVEAHKGARGPLVIEPPLVLRDADGYTAEAARILGD